MIPKVIHYCWFGKSSLPNDAVRCINSWKKFLKDYEIIEWNETNFDVNMNAYTKKCYDLKKFAFLSDYVRLYVIEKYGGIYFDVDVEVIKSFDDLLVKDGFFCFENEQYINTGLGFGSKKNNFVLKQMLKEYDYLLDGNHGFVSCPSLNTKACENVGFLINGKYQNINNVILLPEDYLNPFNSVTGKMNKTRNTYSIHWYSMTWFSPIKRLKNKLSRPFHRIVENRRKVQFRKENNND